jgi:hypothetical protein
MQLPPESLAGYACHSAEPRPPPSEPHVPKNVLRSRIDKMREPFSGGRFGEPSTVQSRGGTHARRATENDDDGPGSAGGGVRGGGGFRGPSLARGVVGTVGEGLFRGQQTVRKSWDFVCSR